MPPTNEDQELADLQATIDWLFDRPLRVRRNIQARTRSEYYRLYYRARKEEQGYLANKRQYAREYRLRKLGGLDNASMDRASHDKASAISREDHG